MPLSLHALRPHDAAPPLRGPHGRKGPHDLAAHDFIPLAAWLRLLFFVAVASTTGSLKADERAVEFASTIRPLLVAHCEDCHSPLDPDAPLPFLKAEQLKDIQSARADWKSIVQQLRNRTMPPQDMDPQPTEAERLMLANWIESYLHASAIAQPPYAGRPLPRRLNRDEYARTIRDLLGVETSFHETFPVDGGGGEGFSNNAETLFLPPMLMERYLEAAQQVLDQAIISPPIHRTYDGDQLDCDALLQNGRRVLTAGQEAGATVAVPVGVDYRVEVAARLSQEESAAVQEEPATLIFKVDGIPAHQFQLERGDERPAAASTTVRLARGVHRLSLRAPDESAPIQIQRLQLESQRDNVSDERRAAHERLLDLDANTPGDQRHPQPRARRRHAERVVGRFARRAFRRPVHQDEMNRLMALYDRAAPRGDGFEESVKLAFKAVLVSPKFLYRAEREPEDAGLHPVDDYELATRLSYFLWSSMPDDELLQSAESGRLHDPEILLAQTRRMIADPRADALFELFAGQWLGTQDVGGKIAPVGDQRQQGYSTELGYAMRDEPQHLLAYVFREDRSLLELIDADYVMINERLGDHYGIDAVDGERYRIVSTTNQQRGGLLGLGAVHMATSLPNRTSPVLRGAWVLETLLGIKLPAPPPDVPPLESGKKSTKGMTLREKLQLHRDQPACAACHDVIDPIGYGLDNYDQLGRWRDEADDQPIDVSATMPTGESFQGPAELRRVLLNRKDEFARHLTRKMLGYALGRSLEDKDDGTIERLAQDLAADDYRAKSLIRGIVLSTPFLNRQGSDHRQDNDVDVSASHHE